MITEDQAAVATFLQNPSTHGDHSVDRIDTHSAMVFLAGTLAYKMKRAVRFDYLDFSTAEKRHAMCAEELRLNRRAAPGIYRRIVPVTREVDGSPAIDGTGVPIEWLIEMNRFDGTQLLDRLAVAHRLDLDMMRTLGVAIAGFHAGAEKRVDHGGSNAMSWVIEGNAAGLHEFGNGVFPPGAIDRVTAASRQALRVCTPLLERRRRDGSVRQCHGNLHLGNIVLVDGHPVLFDGVEFNDEISCVDVLYDVAFLLTDLWHRGLPAEANALFNSYMTATGDLEGLALLPLFMSCRAAIRAKTSVTAASVQPDREARARAEQAAREYLALAERLLGPPGPSLIAIGGYSGSGKSTLAVALAPSIGRPPGALVLRSDEIRKHLGGVDPLQRLGPDGYSGRVTHEVYETLCQRSRAVLQAKHAAIADAVFARRADREAIETIACHSQVRFCGLWLDAPESTLVDRVTRRGEDASDATPAIVRQQRGAGTGRIDWEPLDTLLPLQRNVEAAITLASASLATAHHPTG